MKVHNLIQKNLKCRLRAAGLLPLCRMVELTTANDKRFSYDRSLIAALVDRWRPETHTFHLPVGEMAPTLQDVSYLLGLPCGGHPVVPHDAPIHWQQDLTDRFAGLPRHPEAAPYQPLRSSERHGPTHSWLLQFTVIRKLIIFLSFT